MEGRDETSALKPITCVICNVMWMTKYTLDTSAQPGGGGNNNDLHKTLKKPE